MHASPAIKEALILAKMKRCLSIIQNPFLSRKHTTTEVRRNFLKLVRRHKLWRPHGGSNEDEIITLTQLSDHS